MTLRLRSGRLPRKLRREPADFTPALPVHFTTRAANQRITTSYPRCRYCGEMRDLKMSLRGVGEYRCRSFYTCLKGRPILTSRDAGIGGAHIIRDRSQRSDSHQEVVLRCFEYFVYRVHAIRRTRRKNLQWYEDRGLDGGGWVWPYRSMEGCADMPGQLAALDDMEYRRELARLREVCRRDTMNGRGK